MSELKNETLLVGQPIRERHGITCCPAIDEASGEQFYVKTIRIPASAVQASGLLLSGAYENAHQLQEYYQSIADELCDEAALLKKMEGNGFLPFRDWSLSPVENGVGFQLELISNRYESIINTQWTHRQALDMTIDVCNALSYCRSQGMLYADLKPENIFVDHQGSYCIGDLGFMSMASLQFSSLPEKYRSNYTAPEVADEYANVSANMDVYALGMILYSIYNEGLLPTGEQTPPLHADYELWKIISVACHPDPSVRYEDPAQFGNAVFEYLQLFGTSDDLIGACEEQMAAISDEEALFLTDEENDAMLSQLLATIPEEQTPADVVDSLMAASEENEELEMSEMLAQADDLISHQLPQPVVAPAVIDVQLPQMPIIEQQPQVETESEPEPITQTVEITSLLTEEAGQMPVLEVEPKEPEVVCTEDVPEEVVEIAEAPEDAEEDDTDEEIWDAPKKKNVKKILIVLSAIAAALALLIGGAVFYYFNIYTLNVKDIELTVIGSTVTVNIHSDIDDEMLTVVCRKSSGDTQKVALSQGQATISGLDPDTTYTISLEISGFHQLRGETSEIFNTPAIIHVSGLSVYTAEWKGWVKLSFVASGNQDWIVRYFAEGETEKSVSFSGAEVSIGGLTTGKEYTFILEAQNGAPILGSYQSKYVAH